MVTRRTFCVLLAGAAQQMRSGQWMSAAAQSFAAHDGTQFPPLPNSARPYVLWMWMGHNISAAGITRDLEAMREAQKSRKPIQLLVENTEYYRTVSFDYFDGPMFPHLVRDTTKPDLLSNIIKPKVTTLPKPVPNTE